MDKVFQFKSLSHCRDILRFSIAYLKEKGYQDQASAVSRAVVEIEQDERSSAVQKWIEERDAATKNI